MSLIEIQMFLCIFSGNGDVDEALRVILGNPNFVGTVLSCFLDNTIPGKIERHFNTFLGESMQLIPIFSVYDKCRHIYGVLAEPVFASQELMIQKKTMYVNIRWQKCAC